MKVVKITTVSPAKYPNRRQFLTSGVVIGATAIGLDLLAGACSHVSRSPVYSTSTAGLPPMEPMQRKQATRFTADYVVKPGDTLYGISERTLGTGGRWREIAGLNDGLSPDTLKAGQTIRVPASDPQSQAVF